LPFVTELHTYIGLEASPYFGNFIIAKFDSIFFVNFQEKEVYKIKRGHTPGLDN
jgi:hypothetical protein